MNAIEAQDPLDELERENDVAEKLIERLAEMAIVLKEGRNLPPGEISEGLRLLEQYRTVHAARVDVDLKVEARPWAMSTCFQHLDAIANDHQTEGDRIARAQEALKEFTLDPEEARARLSQALADLTEKDHQSLVYENDYPLSCLRAALPDGAASRVSAAFEATSSAIADLDGHIVRYLEHAPGTPGHGLTVRCSRANCEASAESHVVSSNDGRLGIEVPLGWQVAPQSPNFSKDRTIRLKVDFCCPAHHEKCLAHEGKALPMWMDEGGLGPQRETTAGRGSGGCCGPIPEDAR
ncbi:MAG TPA: hypothetical protein VMV28_06910 [Thermoplasmata archaeon]|nr:hypothetical protein [Thermoplasmata archaeon]